MGVKCDKSGLKTWFPLQEACPTAVFPWVRPNMRRMVYLDFIFSLLFRNGLSSNDQETKLGPAVCVGSDWGFG